MRNYLEEEDTAGFADLALEIGHGDYSNIDGKITVPCKLRLYDKIR